MPLRQVLLPAGMALAGKNLWRRFGVDPIGVLEGAGQALETQSISSPGSRRGQRWRDAQPAAPTYQGPAFRDPAQFQGSGVGGGNAGASTADQWEQNRRPLPSDNNSTIPDHTPGSRTEPIINGRPGEVSGRALNIAAQNAGLPAFRWEDNADMRDAAYGAGRAALEARANQSGAGALSAGSLPDTSNPASQAYWDRADIQAWANASEGNRLLAQRLKERHGFTGQPQMNLRQASATAAVAPTGNFGEPAPQGWPLQAPAGPTAQELATAAADNPGFNAGAMNGPDFRPGPAPIAPVFPSTGELNAGGALAQAGASTMNAVPFDSSGVQPDAAFPTDPRLSLLDSSPDGQRRRALLRDHLQRIQQGFAGVR